MIVNPVKLGKDARKMFTFNKVYGTTVTQRKSFDIRIGFAYYITELRDLKIAVKNWCLSILQSIYMQIHRHSSDLLWMVSMFVFLHMARPALGRHIPWYVAVTRYAFSKILIWLCIEEWIYIVTIK